MSGGGRPGTTKAATLAPVLVELVRPDPVGPRARHKCRDECPTEAQSQNHGKCHSSWGPTTPDGLQTVPAFRLTAIRSAKRSPLGRTGDRRRARVPSQPGPRGRRLPGALSSRGRPAVLLTSLEPELEHEAQSRCLLVAFEHTCRCSYSGDKPNGIRDSLPSRGGLPGAPAAEKTSLKPDGRTTGGAQGALWPDGTHDPEASDVAAPEFATRAGAVGPWDDYGDAESAVRRRLSPCLG